MSDFSDIEKVAKALGDSYFEDFKKDMKHIMPKWFESMVKQGLKPIPQIEARIDRMEQNLNQLGKDVDRLLLLNEQQTENTAEVKLNTKELPKKVGTVVTQSHKEFASAVGKDLENLSEQKSKGLRAFISKLRRNK